MTPDVIRVTALPDFLLEAEFADGEVRRFDMRPYLDYPAFAELRKNALYRRATVVNGTVTLTDEIDLSPDTLYLRGTRVKVPAKSPLPLNP